MIIPFVIAGAVGAWATARTKPTSTVKKRECLGTKSGWTYEVDDFPDSGIILVHSPKGAPKAVGTFKRKADSLGFEWVDGKGSRDVLALMIRDFL